MIFGNGFDKSLWMILKSDKNNRKDLINLLSLAPTYFIENIQNDVRKYENLSENDKTNTNYTGKCTAYYGETYSYLIENGTLSLSIYYDGDSSFKYTLKLGNLSNNYIGSIINNMKNNGEEISYILNKTSLGYRVKFKNTKKNREQERAIILNFYPKNFNMNKIAKSN